MNVTVIVCTFNRSSLLRTSLESIAASRMDEDLAWEILVCDNNSSDGTHAVVEDFCVRSPGRFRYLFEPRPGKSNALNAAIVAARGDILAFADDDVIVHPDWLRNLTAPLLTGEWVGSGGRVLPEWKASVPGWLDPNSWMTDGPLVQFDRGPHGGPLRETPAGTNMAFRRWVFERYGDFRTDLGPRPGSEIRNEDSEFVRRLLRAGEPMVYEPSAIVYHPVPVNRLSTEYFLAWWFDKGRSNVRESGISPDVRWKIGGIPLYLFRRVARWSGQWIFCFDQRARFDRKVRVWNLAGEIAECRRISAAGTLKSPETAIAVSK